MKPPLESFRGTMSQVPDIPGYTIEKCGTNLEETC